MSEEIIEQTISEPIQQSPTEIQGKESFVKHGYKLLLTTPELWIVILGVCCLICGIAFAIAFSVQGLYPSYTHDDDHITGKWKQLKKDNKPLHDISLFAAWGIAGWWIMSVFILGVGTYKLLVKEGKIKPRAKSNSQPEII